MKEYDAAMARRYFTRSKVAIEFKAAGVLPFCILPTGEALALLGAEMSRTGPQGRMRKTMCKNPSLPCPHNMVSVDIDFTGY